MLERQKKVNRCAVTPAQASRFYGRLTSKPCQQGMTIHARPSRAILTLARKHHLRNAHRPTLRLPRLDRPSRGLGSSNLRHLSDHADCGKPRIRMKLGGHRSRRQRPRTLVRLFVCRVSARQVRSGSWGMAACRGVKCKMGKLRKCGLFR